MCFYVMTKWITNIGIRLTSFGSVHASMLLFTRKVHKAIYEKEQNIKGWWWIKILILWQYTLPNIYSKSHIVIAFLTFMFLHKSSSNIGFFMKMKMTSTIESARSYNETPLISSNDPLTPIFLCMLLSLFSVSTHHHKSTNQANTICIKLE